MYKSDVIKVICEIPHCFEANPFSNPLFLRQTIYGQNFSKFSKKFLESFNFVNFLLYFSPPQTKKFCPEVSQKKNQIISGI